MPEITVQQTPYRVSYSAAAWAVIQKTREAERLEKARMARLLAEPDDDGVEFTPADLEDDDPEPCPPNYSAETAARLDRARWASREEVGDGDPIAPAWCRDVRSLVALVREFQTVTPAVARTMDLVRPGLEPHEIARAQASYMAWRWLYHGICKEALLFADMPACGGAVSAPLVEQVNRFYDWVNYGLHGEMLKAWSVIEGDAPDASARKRGYWGTVKQDPKLVERTNKARRAYDKRPDVKEERKRRDAVDLPLQSARRLVRKWKKRLEALDASDPARADAQARYDAAVAALEALEASS